jgi:hypothetical protein
MLTCTFSQANLNKMANRAVLGCAAHIRENKRKCGDFRFRFEAKKSVFFRFVRMGAKHSKQRKKWKRTESEAKREAKNPTLFP